MEKYENRANLALKDLGYSLARTTELSKCILELSDFYIHCYGETTPWKNKSTMAAHLAYYFPINYVKTLKVLKEAKDIGFLSNNIRLIDFGAGLSPLIAAAKNTFSDDGISFVAVEQEKSCESVFKQIEPDISVEWKKSIPAQAKNDVLGFSYSLLELQSLPPWLFDYEKLIIIEPSDRNSGRKLMELRQKLIEEGYFLWAPCTHQGSCPLLSNSKTDWCHDRAHWQMPAWFQKIENHLPMKNKTVTYSYLLASRENPPSRLSKLARLTGDSQKEKGKTKQLVCRSNEREFLTWLDRRGEAPDLKRGDLIELPADLIKVSNELRYP